MGLELDEYLNEKTQNIYDFQLKKATLSKRSGQCKVEMFYKDGVILPPEKRKECEEILKEVLPLGFEYQFKFTKNFAHKDAVLQKVKEFFAKNHPAITYEIQNVECEGEDKNITLAFDEKQDEYLKSKKIVLNLEEFIQNSFNIQIPVVCLKKDFSETKDDLPFESMTVEDTFIPALRTILVSNVEPIVGDLVDNQAFYIKDKKTAGEEVVFCGRMSFFKEYSYTPKSKDKGKEDTGEKQEDAGKNSQNQDSPEGQENDNVPQKNERKYFKFVVEDFSGKISCIFFANKNNYAQALTIDSSCPVIVSGRLEEDKFGGGVSLRVKSISKCVLPEKFEEEIIFKPEPENYTYIFPEDYVYYAQADLFTMDETKVNEKLIGRDFVVFDFETTGLEVASGDRIIEIGAVKVSNGKIIQKFECMVDPKMHIPEDSTAVHGIRDEDVKGAHTYQEVLQDFYKFTRNATLVGYNVSFDFGFLSFYGKKSGYNFDNPLLDAYKMAQKGVKGTKNYKLGTIAEKLGVLLDNAHRAVYDAIATAEVFMKLADYIY